MANILGMLPASGTPGCLKPSDLPLVGRDHELRLIQDLIDGVGGALVFSGDAGAGKTVLLDAAAATAQRSGWRVLRAAGAEFEADVGYAALHQALFPVIARLGGLSSASRDALTVALGIGDGPPPRRAAVAAAVVELSRQPGTGPGVLLVIDDLQWLDRSSAAVLNLIARTRGGAPIGFIGGLRNDTASHFDTAGVPDHRLPPLGPSTSAAMLRRRFPALPARVRTRVVEAAQGNPLALLELPAALTDGQRAAPGTLPDVLPVSLHAQELFAGRVRALPAPTRALLLLAALAGADDALFGVPWADTGANQMEVLHPAELAGLVVRGPAGSAFAFRHPLVRATVVGLSSFDERRRAHLDLADGMVDQPERRAWHLADASLGPDEAIAVLLDEAARRALGRGDVVGAVSALVRAADLSPGGNERGRRLAEAAYIGADLAGDLRNASRLLDSARAGDVEFGSSPQAATAAAFLVLHDGGHVDTAHGLVSGALENQAGPWDADDHAVTEAIQTLFEVCYFAGGRADLWSAFHAAVARLAPEAPMALHLYDTVAADPARAAPEALATLDATLAELPHERDAAKVIRVGVSAVMVDRVAGIRNRMWEVVNDARAGGTVTAGIEAMVYLGLDDFFSGRWRAAQALIGEGLELCEIHGYALLAWPLSFVQAMLAGGRGDESTLRRVCDDLTRWGASRGSGTITGYASWAQALAASGRGDFETAYKQATAVSPAGVLASHSPVALWAAFDVVEAALQTRRVAAAQAHVAAMRADDIRSLSTRMALVVEASCGMIATNEAEAEAHFQQALALPGATEWQFDAARVRLAFGERLWRAGDASRAAIQLRAAGAAFEEMGRRALDQAR